MTRDPFGHDTVVFDEPICPPRRARHKRAHGRSDPTWSSKVIGGGLVLLAIASALLAAGFLMIALNEHGVGWGSKDDTLVQQDEVNVAGSQQQDVYYPIPYSRSPNLTLDDDMGHFVVVQQFPDHFRVGNLSPYNESVNWKAKGSRSAMP
jgi:hypothetical protein